MYSILIVEDEPIIRRGIASLIDFEALGISTVQEVENGEQFQQQLHRTLKHYYSLIWQDECCRILIL